MMKIMALITIVILSGFLLIFQIAQAEIYKWVDEKGTVHFTEDPSRFPEKYWNEIKSRQTEKDKTKPEEKVKAKEEFERKQKTHFEKDSKLSQTEIQFSAKTIIGFTSVDKGKEILMTRDDFIERLSPFDRAARMKTDKNISEREFLSFVGNNVLPWDEAEKQKVANAFRSIQPRIETLSLLFPEKIHMVKTTGNEEGGAAYTRGDAIILPKAKLALDTRALQELICHELFHIFSRANHNTRERLYGAIGFMKCNEVEFPVTLKSRKITNPDAPRNDHCIRLQVGRKESWAVPILFATTEKYDMSRGGEFFDYLNFQLLLVERSGNPPIVKPLFDGSKPRLVDVQQVSGFFEQVGRNTEYIIHPEEILADNFVLLVLGGRSVPSPDVLDRIKRVLTKR